MHASAWIPLVRVVDSVDVFRHQRLRRVEEHSPVGAERAVLVARREGGSDEVLSCRGSVRGGLLSIRAAGSACQRVVQRVEGIQLATAVAAADSLVVVGPAAHAEQPRAVRRAEEQEPPVRRDARLPRDDDPVVPGDVILVEVARRRAQHADEAQAWAGASPRSVRPHEDARGAVGNRRLPGDQLCRGGEVDRVAVVAGAEHRGDAGRRCGERRILDRQARQATSSRRARLEHVEVRLRRRVVGEPLRRREEDAGAVGAGLPVQGDLVRVGR